MITDTKKIEIYICKNCGYKTKFWKNNKPKQCKNCKGTNLMFVEERRIMTK